jgi:hypothetical protein
MFKLNLINHFQTYLLFTFIVPKILKFYKSSHYKIKEKHHAFIILFKTIFNPLSSTYVKN